MAQKERLLFCSLAATKCKGIITTSWPSTREVIKKYLKFLDLKVDQTEQQNFLESYLEIVLILENVSLWLSLRTKVKSQAALPLR